MGFLQRLFGGGSGDMARSEIIYHQLMAQSRTPEFFGEGRMPDSYDGRLDLLTMHMAVYLAAVRKSEAEEGVDTGKNKEGSFSQKVFDVMVKDFDTALREEGYTDTGVKKRIKPMVGFFYKRLKLLTESLDNQEELTTTIAQGASGDAASGFAERMSKYMTEFDEILAGNSLSELINSDLKFPNF